MATARIKIGASLTLVWLGKKKEENILFVVFHDGPLDGVRLRMVKPLPKRLLMDMGRSTYACEPSKDNHYRYVQEDK